MRFSKEIQDSPTLKLGEVARKRQQEGKPVISLALGEPDFKTPKYILDATSKALYDGLTTYSTPQGILPLRQYIAKDYNNTYGSNYGASEVIIMPGAKAAIFASLASLLDVNDEVIILSPFYVSYPPMIKLAETTAKIIDIPLNSDFSLPIDKIKASITKNTKVLILNYPNNPTGKLLTTNEIEAVLEIIKENNIYLLSDEIYEKQVFGNNPFVSFSSFNEIKDKTLIINGYSKTFAMTGFRIGFILGSKELIKKINLLNQNINTNTNTFVQYGCLSIYENNNTHLETYNKELLERSTYLYNELSKTMYFKPIKPESTFYMFVDITNTKLDSTTLSNMLIEQYGLVVTPGIAFGKNFDNYIRLSFATAKDNLIKAVEIFKAIKL
ncbi:MAG TPA: aminotransferase class I/II-fold pyridoxal phosphate-dependent enzyme [Haploplasma sp.]|nr:aminotransferase class I/II-fold pyridoxal phosphate-dependent enzyme [Haploplasma sp.]